MRSIATTCSSKTPAIKLPGPSVTTPASRRALRAPHGAGVCRKGLPQLRARTDLISALGLGLLICACGEGGGETALAAGETPLSPLFESIPAAASGLTFRNDLREGPNANILLYEYFYNGGGVAVGDFDGDGREDIYLSANMGDNRLYLNRTAGPAAPFRFEDVTEAAGVAGRPGPWKTGVSAADVDGDGLVDLFVAYSGILPADKRRNQLFINRGPDAAGVPRFTEEAAAWGLDAADYTNQAYFFDADDDGDLDLLLLNHNPQNLPILNVAQTRDLRNVDDRERGTRLLINVGGRFEDRTREAGLEGSALSYGLSAALSDFDGDGRTDIYICNDYAVPDQLYRNLGGGRFTDVRADQMDYTSNFSMGSDAADVNGDGRTDLLTLDMLPSGNKRQKLLQGPDNYAKFDHNVATGFGHQYMRNMLHLNDGEAGFTEVGQMAGVSATDWSWAALLADFDLDGYRDLYVTNGYRRDFTNLDFVRYLQDLTSTGARISKADVLGVVARMPSDPVRNEAFRGGPATKFDPVAAAWGLDLSAYSQGAAYADFDGDGDLDLVVNNLDTTAALYRNTAAAAPDRHYLRLRLRGAGGNTAAIGARAWLYAGERSWLVEQYPARGYQSSVSQVLHFGLGSTARADSLVVAWPGGGRTLVIAPRLDTILTLDASGAQQSPRSVARAAPSSYFQATDTFAGYRHAGAAARDFDRQKLLLTELSGAGPVVLAIDGSGGTGGTPTNLFVGGGRGQASVILRPDARGVLRQVATLEREFPLAGAVWGATTLDADGDGFLDLYLAVGGYHDFAPAAPELQDELWLGRGRGTFTRAPQGNLPDVTGANGSVVALDFDGDGDEDLFVGGRVVPGRYPEPPQSTLLRNEGGGRFTDAGAAVGTLAEAGMVTAAVRLDREGRPGLLLAVDWGRPRYFVWGGTAFAEAELGLPEGLHGCWTTVALAELNGDGRPDILLGNQGLNGPFQPTPAQPMWLHFADFDGNGVVDPIFGRYFGDTLYPHATRDEALAQLSGLAKRFPDYATYARQDFPAVLAQLGSPAGASQALRAERLATTLLLTAPGGGYTFADLPPEAQYAPVHLILPTDVDSDGHEDLLLFGDDRRRQLRLGRATGIRGLVLLGDGRGGLRAVPPERSGLRPRGDVRGGTLIGRQLYLGVSRGAIESYRLSPPNAL